MGKKKPVKLTPAEKKALKEKAKLAEKLRLDEIEREKKRKHLAREIYYTSLSERRLGKQWKQALIEMKLPDIKIEFTYTLHHMERIFDLKNFVISLLLDEVDVVEQRYIMNFRAHCEMIDTILMIFHNRLDDLKSKFNNKLRDMMDTNNEEIETLKSKHKNEEDCYKTVLFGIGEEKKNIEKFIKSEYLAKLDEEIYRFDTHLHAKKYKLESQYNNGWHKFKSILTAYITDTADVKKKYNQLKEQDSVMQSLIKELILKIFVSYDLIRRLKDQQLYDKGNLDERTGDLQGEKDFLSNAFKTLKDRFIKDTNNDNCKMLTVTAQSHTIIEELQRKIQLGKKILTLMSICRKFETQKEKVSAFPDYGVNLEGTGKEFKDKSRTYIKYVETRSELNNFWQKCGQADTLRHTLNEEMLYLKQENAYLKNEIQAYCKESKHECCSSTVKGNRHKNICVMKIFRNV